MADAAPVMGGRPRRRLLRWGGWFAIVNGLVMGIIGLRYLLHYQLPSDWLAIVYTVVAYVGHFASLAYAPFLVLVVPLTLLLPRRRLVMGVAIGLATFGLTLLVVDSLVFAESRFHLTAFTVAILGWKTWGFAIVFFLIILSFEIGLAQWCWKRFGKPATRKTGVLLAVPLVACVAATQLLHIWADANYYAPITAFTHYLPVFFPQTAKGEMVQYGLVDMEASRKRAIVDRLGSNRSELLDYPLAPLDCVGPEPPLNVLIVMADALRRDVTNATRTPRIAAFAERAQVFDRHFSGGNSSRSGQFSLFYGLPSTYWVSFMTAQRSPVLVDLFQEHDYQLGIFSAGDIYRPAALDRTVFASVPDLRGSPRHMPRAEKDATITAEWLEFLESRDPDRPFFGFLLYDAPGSLEYTESFQPVVRPPADATEPQKLRARYDTSASFVDSLIGTVVDDLEARDLLSDTVVVITADHGEEFDDSGLGYNKHGSAYTSYQLHTPMIVYWPGRAPARTDRRTSHNDLGPTLLTELFGCRNPPTDYSSGQSLFSDAEWDWLIVGSYYNFAVLEPDQVTVHYPPGYYEVRDERYRVIDRPEVNWSAITEAVEEMGRFYR